MPTSRALISLLIACLTLGAAAGYVRSADAAAAKQRVALIIGNSAYPSARLSNPVNDANAMAAKLRTLGFDVILRTDATQREMSRAINEFGTKLKLGSVGLFYFAGHGMQLRGKNFLIPVDAEIASEGAVRGEAVDVDHVLDQLGPAQLSMVILDACRNNPFESRFRRVGGGLAQIDAPTGTLLAYATAPGKLAADGAGSNGTYTAALLRAIDMPGLKVEDVFKQVRNEVIKTSDNQQIPWESSSLTTEFYFRPGTKVQIENAQLQQSERQRAELLKEMEKLRAELLSLRETPGAAAAPAQASSPASVTAVASAPASSPPASPAMGSALPAPPAGEWAQRIAQLEKARGEPTLSKAAAILLDVNSPEDLTQLLAHERELRRKAWNNSYALGTDHQGGLIWGGGYQLTTAADAAETALQQCAVQPGDSCKVVMVNGEFRQKDFTEIAKQLGAMDVSATRQAFMKSLTAPFAETKVGNAAGRSGTLGGWAIGYSSTRK